MIIGILPFDTPMPHRSFCASSPDYTRLARLRKLYPHVPILALSATCSPGSLRDLMAILRLPTPTDGKGTVTLAASGLLMADQSVSCDALRHCQVFQPSLSRESPLQDCFEALSLWAGRERYGPVHTRTPPQ
jgi:hypothetical protein